MEDLDGEPFEEDLNQKKKKSTGAFVPSKWEAVDPEQIEAQAMTTSKWDLLEPPQHVKKNKFTSYRLIIRTFNLISKYNPGRRKFGTKSGGYRKRR